MALPPNSGIPIVPLFSSVPTSRSSWNSSPLWATRQLDLQVGPTHVHEDRVWTSDGSTLNQLPAKRPKMDSPLSQGSSFNTSSDTSADQTVPLDLTKKKCDDGLRMTEKRDIENVPSAPSSARDGTPVPTNRTLPNSWHTPVPTSRTLPRSWHTPVTISRTFPRSWHTPCECPATSSAGWEDPTHVHEASDRSTLNQSPTKRPKKDSPLSQGSSFNTSSDTSYDGRKMTIQGKPNPSSHKETTKRDIGIDFPLEIRRTPEQTFNCTSVHPSDNEKDSKKLIDSLDLDRIKNFNETEFEYSDGVIAAGSLEPWIKASKKFFKEEEEQKAIIVLPKGESIVLPEGESSRKYLDELVELANRAETNFINVKFLCQKGSDRPCRHYKFIFEGGFELHVAEKLRDNKYHYFGRFPTDQAVFYELNDPTPTLSNDILKILNEEEVWEFSFRRSFGKTITVSNENKKFGDNQITKFPRLWFDEGLVILYNLVKKSQKMGKKRPNLAKSRELLDRINPWKNTVSVTREDVTEAELKEFPCANCVKYTFNGKAIELYKVQFVGQGQRFYCYLRDMDRPHVFFMLNQRDQLKEVESFLLAKDIPVDVERGEFQLADRPAATLVSRARSQLGTMTEKKTRESNYQGLVLVSMVSCLVFVSTYWALGKKEENDAATRGSHSRSKSKKNNPPKHDPSRKQTKDF